ncbi:thymocyte nuclear protein 1 [Biomphalaria pfeifferi]|uniref:Thymocyte nuclear protein 1 n=1 Tax=Biomphalaria pfeifferi TaxID=112525 RepID=A0AAD8F5P1_BIOPF|nr:thymocyte nuclear protein 1 [Biomphalaria pfeifferi]
MPPKRASLKRKISHCDETNEQDVLESVGKTKKKSVTKAEKNNTTKSFPREKSTSKPSACASQSYKHCFNDLQSSPNQTSSWDGVRNYQARNFLRDQMKPGQDVFFYHSNCKEPGIVGICQVVKEGYPDHTQFDSKNPHFDSSSQKDNPKWFMVDVKLVRPLKRFISLAELKGLHQEHLKSGGPLQKLGLFTRPRLSVQPITDEEWSYILELENKDA